MNRGTALLLALAALLAHALIVHTDGAGSFAPPHDAAQAAYHVARNAVQRGELAWYVPSSGAEHAVGGLESYPSPLLIGVAFVAERLYLPVTRFCQTAGILAALATVVITASFATNRVVGVVPPLLLVASGGVAAVAASGTELPLAMLLLTAAFVGLEHRRRLRLASALALLVAARPEGLVLAGCVALLVLIERLVPRRDGSPPTPVWVLVPGLVVAGLLVAVPTRSGASLYGSMLADLFTPDGRRLEAGLLYLLDFLATSIVPFLLAFPLAMAVLGKLSGAGLRALALAAAWSALIVLEGGGSPVFGAHLVPTLPLICVASQQGIVAALDLGVRAIERVAWVVLALVVLASALVSKYPGDLGPLPLDGLHRSWMTASSPSGFGREGLLGRLALREEIEMSVRLRALGATLRAEIQGDFTLATPWPGAVGYLSRLRVVDLLGRVDAGERTSLTWYQRPGVDTLAALAAAPDFVFLGFLTRGQVARSALLSELALTLRELDSNPDRALGEIEAALTPYELVTLTPAPELAGGAVLQPFYLLRRRDLGLAPQLGLELEQGRLGVDARGQPEGALGQAQMARLRLSALDELGRVWFVTPTGQLVRNPRVSARIGLYVYPSTRSVRLFDAVLPTASGGARLTEVRAQLQNPGTRGEHPLALVGSEAVLQLPR